MSPVLSVGCGTGGVRQLRVLLSSVLLVFLVVQTHKCYAIFVHAKWVLRNGRKFHKALKRLRRAHRAGNGLPPPSNREISEAIRRIEGRDFLRMGYREFYGRAYADRFLERGSLAGKLIGGALHVGVRLYDFLFLGGVGGVLLVAASDAYRASLWPEAKIFGAASCGVLALSCFLLAMEATAGYASMKSYGVLHHNLKRYTAGAHMDRFFTEARILIGIAVSAIYVDTAGLSFLSNVGWVADLGIGQQVGLGGLFNDLYGVILTFVLASPFSSDGVAAKVFILAVSLQGLSLLVVALTTFSGAIEMGGGRLGRRGPRIPQQRSEQVSPPVSADG